MADGAYADLVLDTLLNRSRLEGRDRRLVTELVYGTLRLQGRLDFALEQFCDQPLARLQPEVLRLLRLGAYQLLELDRIPAHAAVSSTVELTRELGFPRATGLVNGVLRALARGGAEIPWPPPDKIRAYLQHVCSLPVWLARELMRQLPNAQARALGESLATAAPLCLRVNRLKIGPDAYLAALGEAGHRARPGLFAPEAVIVEQRSEEPLPGDEQGWYQVQDQASMLVPHLLQAEPGQRILDACAAPGGKTTQLAALTDDRAGIIALDKHPRRVELIREGAQRLGCTSIEALCWDLETAPDFLAAGSFDRILVDAPCSGLGVLRRNPEGRWKMTGAALRQLAVLQQRILDNVAPLLKPGGRLLYSVCTFSEIETEAVAAGFLDRQPDYRAEDLRPLMPPNWQELFDAAGRLRSFPHCHDGMDAFFAACFRRSDQG